MTDNNADLIRNWSGVEGLVEYPSSFLLQFHIVSLFHRVRPQLEPVIPRLVSYFKQEQGLYKIHKSMISSISLNRLIKNSSSSQSTRRGTTNIPRKRLCNLHI